MSNQKCWAQHIMEESKKTDRAMGYSLMIFGIAYCLFAIILIAWDWHIGFTTFAEGLVGLITLCALGAFVIVMGGLMAKS